MPDLLRLLWLDPDDSTVASGSQTLTEQGWTVDQARNLVEALDWASQVPYDAVILDLQLPDTLGTEAWLCIRKLQPTIIGVLTTRSSSLIDVIRVDSPGLLAYVCKPLHMEVIMSKIVSSLVLHRLRKLND